MSTTPLPPNQPPLARSVTPGTEPAVTLRGLTKTFGPKVAVNNLDLSIPQGSVYGFIGQNGAGKTTTIRMIMSIIFPDRGEIRVLGRASAVESKDRIGYLPEERGLYRKMKVGAFLEYIGKLKGLDGGGSLDRRIAGWLERTGLAETKRKRCEELSKGMQQKVQFIASVIHEPDLVILDEPFSGLDPSNRRLLRQLIREQREAHRTIIFSTHAMFEAEQLCTHLFMIHKGNKVLDDSLESVFRSHDPRTVVAEPLAAHDVAATGWDTIAGVQEVRRHGSFVELRLEASTQASDVMPRAASVAPLRRLELARPNLEEIFIGLVGGDVAALRAEQEELAGTATAASGGDA
jgi:ABC-2 type transport system ATP-binding protein